MTEPRPTYSVVAERPESVREDLHRIWRENLTLGMSAEDKFRWLYEDAPETTDRVFVLRVRAADGTERVVGTKGVTVRRYWLANRDGWAAISGDFAVEPAHRHLFPALQLARTAREYVKERYEIGYGLPNDKAEPVMLRAGFRVLGKAQRYVRVLRHAAYAARLRDQEGVPPIVVRVAGIPGLARVAGAVADVGRLALDAPRTLRAAAGHRLEWGRRPDARFDALWAAARGEYGVVGARTSAFLAWRYPAADLATLARRADGSLRAYAVVQAEEASGAACVRDLFGHLDSLGALLDLLLPALWSRGANSVSVRFMGAPKVARLLLDRGFVVRGKGRTVVAQIGDRAREDHAPIADADRWHLFDADEDA